MAAARQAVVYLRVTPKDRQELTLDVQLEHILAFSALHSIEEIARFEDRGTEGVEGLRTAARHAIRHGVFVLLDHVDDFEQVVAVLNAEGANFISAQSSNQALYSFFNDYASS